MMNIIRIFPSNRGILDLAHEKNLPGFSVLYEEDEGMIGSEGNWLWGGWTNRCSIFHHNSRGGSCFRPLLVNFNEGLVDHFADVQIP